MPQAVPLCEYFGDCGGCVHQDISYESELRIKETELKALLADSLKLKEKIFEPIVASPEQYHYRNRLDLSFRKTRAGEYLMGFKPEKSKYTLQIDSCAIAKTEISNFLPSLRTLSRENLPEGYSIANLVVKTGDDGRVFWGGMGRRSLQMKEADYLWTEPAGRRIFYSMDTFFQANLSILPLLIEKIRSLPLWTKNTVLFDLYAGVGFFTVSLHDLVKKVVMIEEAPSSIKLARFNVDYHRLSHVEVEGGKVEEKLKVTSRAVAIIDPPRKGLSDGAIQALVRAKKLKALLYLSCNPKTLVRDLLHFAGKGWKINAVMPFDFFPKTKHLETLVWLEPKRRF